MIYKRTVPETPIPATIEIMDLHIGVVAEPLPDGKPGKMSVVLTLQPPDGKLEDHKHGTLMKDWPAVLEACSALVDQAQLAFGPLRPR